MMGDEIIKYIKAMEEAGKDGNQEFSLSERVDQLTKMFIEHEARIQRVEKEFNYE